MKKWLYYLATEQGRTYRKERGLVQAKVDRKPLRYTPDGWQDKTLGWERNLEKIGTVRSFSLPLGFVLDGADILRHLSYKKNLEEVVYLIIQKLHLFIDDTTFYYYYDLFYKGELDMSTVVDGELQVKVNLMEGKVSKELKANEGTKYEIPCDEIWVRLETVKLFESGTVRLVENLDIALSDVANSFAVPMITVGDESSVKPGMAFFSQQLEGMGNQTSTSYANTSPNFIAQAAGTNAGPIDFHITGTIRLKITKNDLPFGLRFRWMKSSMTTATQDIYQLPSFSNTLGDHEIAVDSTVTLEPGEKLFLIGIFFGGATGAIDMEFHFLEDSELKIDYQYRHPATFIRAVHPLTLGRRLTEKMTGSADNFVSATLSNWHNLALASGDAIRGLENAKIKTSFNDFFTSFNAILNLGVGIENHKIVMEGKEYFLNATNPMVLGRSRRCEQKIATELMANTFKIGYNNQEYDDVNGRYEFNVQHIYSSPLKRVVAELDLTSVYRADPYGITFTQINLAGRDTTDSAADDDVFILNIDYANPVLDADRGVYYNLKRETYDVITGIPDPVTIFNIEDLTPRRMWERHRSWLNSIMYGFEGQRLTYETGDKNRELYTRKGTIIFDEDENVLISASPRLFLPRTFEFEPETPTALAEEMNLNPNRAFQFTHDRNDRDFIGFTMKIGIAPNTLQEQAFILLSAPTNDLTTLVT